MNCCFEGLPLVLRIDEFLLKRSALTIVSRDGGAAAPFIYPLPQPPRLVELGRDLDFVPPP